MAVELVTTIGSAAANSYVSLDEAADYFETRLNSEAWGATDDTMQTAALLTAMRLFSRLPWIGAPLTTTQALHFPVTGIRPMEQEGEFYQGGASGGGIYDLFRRKFWPVTEIPQPIKDGLCELVLALLQDDSYTDAALRRTRLKSGGLEFDYRTPAGQLPETVEECLRGFLVDNTERMRG